MRQDRSYIGAENVKVKGTENSLHFIEIGLFFLVGIIGIILFLTYAEFIKRCFETGKLYSLLGVFIFLILSPFGAHLIAKMVTFFLERLR